MELGATVIGTGPRRHRGAARVAGSLAFVAPQRPLAGAPHAARVHARGGATSPSRRATPARAATEPAGERGAAEPAPVAVPAPVRRAVCRVCKQQFEPARNHARACRFHPCAWTGAERSKFYGQREQDGVLRRGTEYYFDCCDAKSSDAPGCTFGFHKSYDDE